MITGNASFKIGQSRDNKRVYSSSKQQIADLARKYKKHDAIEIDSSVINNASTRKCF